MPEILIRHRQAGDVHGMAEALAVVHRTDGYPMNWPADPAAWLTPTGMLQSWVAVTGEALVVGHVLLEAPGAVHVASVSRLFVSPNARRRGLGGRLLEHAMEWASARGLNLILEVAEVNGLLQ